MNVWRGDLHADAVVIDAACPDEYWRPHWRDWLTGGATACALTVGRLRDAHDAFYDIAEALAQIGSSPELRLVTSIDDIQAAKAAGQLGVILHFQGPDPLEYEPKLLNGYWRLGVRVIQLAYNRRNPLCDGCEEPVDAGLSVLGRRMVAEMNELGIVVDLSHTGQRSALEAIEASSAPCILSHANPASVHQHGRNVSNELIEAVAECGGVIGVNGYPAFVGPGAQPTLDQFVDHIAYLADLVGPEHVGLGIDYFEMTESEYEFAIRTGTWSADNYPPPPYLYPKGIESPSGLPSLTTRLQERGYADDVIRGFLGQNWMRVFESVWR
jgi:membrane dipeptidase